MEIDPDVIFKLLTQFEKLNANLENSRAAMLTLTSQLKDAAGNAKAMYAAAKQINILNQILMQIGRKAGMAGMLENILRAVVALGKHAR
jgi:hypothetical protein